MSERFNPNDIRGKAFRVPTIVGLGSGAGFQFQDLHLPKDWEAIAVKIKDFGPDKMKPFFEEACESLFIVPEAMKFDKKTGLLTGISVKNQGEVSSVELATDFINISKGAYLSKDLRDLKAAIALQNVVGTWLRYLWREIDFDLSQYYSVITGSPSAYYSHNLSIPKEFFNTEEPLTMSEYQFKFKLKASNIAGRFGKTLREIEFNEKGMLEQFDLHEGNACAYQWDEHDNRFKSHNVDSPEHVATLHGIGASFINSLLSREYKDY